MLDLKKLLTKIIEREKTTCHITFHTIQATCQASAKQSVVYSFPTSPVPENAQNINVIVFQTPNNHWISGYGYYIRAEKKLVINYINNYTGALSGPFTVAIVYEY